jgi:Tol biopolymer transport system component
LDTLKPGYLLQMKKRFTLAVYCIVVLYLIGCSIDISQPVAPTPISEVTSTPPTGNIPDNATPAKGATTVPITWADLNLTGRLVYIAVSSGDDRASKIQVLNLATGEIKTIFTTTKDDWIFYVTISPDAKQLVMSYIPPSQGSSLSNRALYIMPLDGATPPQLLFSPPTPDDHYVQAEWSPDGKYIYYAHYNSNDPLDAPLIPAYDIFRMSYPDGQAEKIVDHAFWPRISSDSTKLVYVSIEPVSGLNELFIANADGSNPQRITLLGPEAPEVIDAPIFSPDGQSILFSAPPPPQAYRPNWFENLMGIQVAKAHSIPSDWWSVPITGGVPTRLTQIQTINLFGSISPDKQHIASLSGEGIFVMGLHGSNLTRLLFNPGVLGTVGWIA